MKRSARIAALSILVTLGLTEILLRVFQLPLPDRFFEPHPEFGWFHIPGRSGWQATPEFRNFVTINTLGLRDAEHGYDKPEGVFRILVLGDSFPEGLQVGDGETVADQLELLLNAIEDGEVEVINGGVSRYGTANELLFYRAEGRKYDPDLVILFFFRNDVIDNAESPFFSIENGQLVEVLPRPMEVLGPAGELRSRLWDLLYIYRLGAVVGSVFAAESGGREMIEGFDPVYFRDPPDEVERGWALTEALFAALAGEVRADGLPLLVVEIPELIRFRSDDAIPEGVDPGNVSRRLAEIMDRVGSAHMDLYPGFSARGPDALYWPGDGHWNLAGHYAAAELVLDFLVTSGWLP